MKTASIDKQTQQEIAEGLRAGRGEAWLRLYDAYAEDIWRRVSQLLGSDAAYVADVVQETFLAAARSASSFDPQRGTLWWWLWGIARRQVALHWRKDGRNKKLGQAQRWWVSLDGQKQDWIDGKADAPPEVLEAKELATLVRSSLAQLPGEYQKMLTAKYIDQAPVQQIAREMDSTDQAVRSKLARARKAFRKVFNRLTRSESKEQEVPS